MFTLLDPARRPAMWEEKLVHYVDKIVEGDTVVSVAERFEALRRRYPEHAEEYVRCLPAVLELEVEIRGRLGISPGAELTQN